jgi:arabinan endo-1,5-alpha-L-arabinosidase
MTSGGGTPVLQSHNWVKAPGGQSVVTDWDHPLLVYHYFDTRSSVDNESAKLGINFLGWDSAGWPYVW